MPQAANRAHLARMLWGRRVRSDGLGIGACGCSSSILGLLSRALALSLAHVGADSGPPPQVLQLQATRRRAGRSCRVRTAWQTDLGIGSHLSLDLGPHLWGLEARGCRRGGPPAGACCPSAAHAELPVPVVEIPLAAAAVAVQEALLAPQRLDQHLVGGRELHELLLVAANIRVQLREERGFFLLGSAIYPGPLVRLYERTVGRSLYNP